MLDKIVYIHYFIKFKKYKNKNVIWALIDAGNEVNIIALAYIAKLDFKMHKTNIKAQKIESQFFET